MSLKKRIEKLEVDGMADADMPMVAELLADGSYAWDGQIFPDKSVFYKALEDCGFTGRLLILDI